MGCIAKNGDNLREQIADMGYEDEDQLLEEALEEEREEKEEMRKAMITWRTNAAIHYIDKNDNPICGAKKPYSEIWFVKDNVTCHKCKQIKETKK